MTETTKPRWELHARSGRAVLVCVAEETRQELDPSHLKLPHSLIAALHEWARSVDALVAPQESGDDPVLLASRHGRQLAMRLAMETGGDISYLDPFTGELNRLGLRGPTRQWEMRRRVAPPPTPWVTGLTISAITATFVTVTFVVITLGLAQINPFAAVAVNLAVAAGFTPSIRLGSRALVWRWVAYGAAVGIVLSWVALLLSML